MFHIVFILPGIIILASLCVLESSSSCRKCIKCLPQPTDAKKILKEFDLMFDHGDCPVKHCLEHSYLQQVLHMFEGHQNWTEKIKKKVPCYSVCTNCCKSVMMKCASMKPHFWDKSYTVLFSQDKVKFLEKLYKKRAEKLYGQLSSMNLEIPTRGKQRCKDCCQVSSVPELFVKKVKIQGSTWYPIFFNHPTHGARHQIFEKIICTPGCSLIETLHSFVVTPLVPNPAFGHAFHLLNHIADDLRFHEVTVGGYCKCQLV